MTGSSALAVINAGRLRAAWLALRVPLLLLAAYVLRDPILDLVERTVDIIWITVFTIQIASTPVTRLVLWAALALGFFIVGKASERLGGVRGYAASVGAGAVLAALVGEASGGGLRMAAPVLVLLACNWAPLSLLQRVGLTWPRLRSLVTIPPAISEVLLAGRYLSWLHASLNNREPATTEEPAKWPGALVAALALALFANAAALSPFERMIRASGDVRVVAHGNFNGIALDESGAHLFVTGHGVERLRRYDVADMSAPPLESAIETGQAQGLAYDATHAEVYVYNEDTREILVLDGPSLALKRSLPAPDLSTGDPWIAIEPISNTVTLASEADQQAGSPLIIYDRTSGEVLARRTEEAGNLLVAPAAPVVYLSFFRRVQGIAALDLVTRDIAVFQSTDVRLERMVFDPISDEVLAAMPTAGEIARFDPRTLAPKGTFPVMFGVRVMAIDQVRGVMLTGSLATGQVALVNLADHQVQRTWYLGPWLRSIALDPARGAAFVSSQGTLYELRYASGP